MCNENFNAAYMFAKRQVGNGAMAACRGDSLTLARSGKSNLKQTSGLPTGSDYFAQLKAQ